MNNNQIKLEVHDTGEKDEKCQQSLSDPIQRTLLINFI